MSLYLKWCHRLSEKQIKYKIPVDYSSEINWPHLNNKQQNKAKVMTQLAYYLCKKVIISFNLVYNLTKLNSSLEIGFTDQELLDGPFLHKKKLPYYNVFTAQTWKHWEPKLWNREWIHVVTGSHLLRGMVIFIVDFELPVHCMLTLDYLC